MGMKPSFGHRRPAKVERAPPAHQDQTAAVVSVQPLPSGHQQMKFTAEHPG
jgi:hypothetical protein